MINEELTKEIEQRLTYALTRRFIQIGMHHVDGVNFLYPERKKIFENDCKCYKVKVSIEKIEEANPCDFIHNFEQVKKEVRSEIG